MSQIVEKDQKIAVGKLKNVLATYNDAEDLINIGAYKNGSNPNIDYAIKKIDTVNEFLMQQVGDKIDFEETVNRLESLFEE
jgi:flagellum-specific ATP synthase